MRKKPWWKKLVKDILNDALNDAQKKMGGKRR